MNSLAPRIILHLEGLTVFAVACLTYRHIGGSWWMFAALFFAPDLFMLGYLAGKSVGAHLYNFAHTYSTPAILGCVAYVTEQTTLPTIALIWIAHIGLDRLLGYGLKYETDFKPTHLQRV